MGGIGALAVAGIAALLRPGLNGRSVIIIQLLVLIMLTALCDWMPIRLWLVPTPVKHAHARQLEVGENFARKAGFIAPVAHRRRRASASCTPPSSVTDYRAQVIHNRVN
jgi:hypothetical protein